MGGLTECIAWAVILMMFALSVTGLMLLGWVVVGWIAEIRNELAEEHLRKALEKEVNHE